MFENLQVYQKAVDFADRVSVLAESFPRDYYYLVDQLNCATLKQLRTVSLNNIAISDDGMKHVKKLKILSTFHLSQTKVTESGLHELVELTELELIALDETPVTSADVKMLLKSLPKRDKVIL